MNTLGTISSGLSVYLTTFVLPGVLAVLGAIVALVFGVYGALRVYALLAGQDSGSVFYKLGRVFGEEIYDNQYRAYSEKREASDRRRSFAARYDREH